MNNLSTAEQQEKILDQIYLDFLFTDLYGDSVSKIESVNPDLYEALAKDGIGTRLLEDGSYDWESGQLLEDLIGISDNDLTEEEYCLVQQIAINYEIYAKQVLGTD